MCFCIVLHHANEACRRADTATSSACMGYRLPAGRQHPQPLLKWTSLPVVEWAMVAMRPPLSPPWVSVNGSVWYRLPNAGLSMRGG